LRRRGRELVVAYLEKGAIGLPCTSLRLDTELLRLSDSGGRCNSS
jgi:hypothetical protein